MKTRGVDERYFSHSDDAYLRTTAVARHDVLEAVAGTEEVGAVDFIDFHIVGNGEVLQIAFLHIGIFVEVDFMEYGVHIGGFGHTAHEEQTGTDESYLDGDGEVEDDGEEEGQQQHGDVALGVAHHGHEGAPAAHTVGNDDEHACQTSHRDILCQRHKEQEDDQEHDRMDDAGNGCASAVVDIGHRAGDGTCGGDAAEEGRSDVGQSLTDEFSVGVVVVADDTVCNGCREQRLDGAQDGNRHRRSCQLLDGFPRQGGNGGLRQL